MRRISVGFTLMVLATLPPTVASGAVQLTATAPPPPPSLSPPSYAELRSVAATVDGEGSVEVAVTMSGPIEDGPWERTLAFSLGTTVKSYGGPECQEHLAFYSAVSPVEQGPADAAQLRIAGYAGALPAIGHLPSATIETWRFSASQLSGLGITCMGRAALDSHIGLHCVPSLSDCLSLSSVAEDGATPAVFAPEAPPPPAAPIVAPPPTRAQKLAKAIKACRRIHASQKRHRCEAAARRRYGHHR